MKALVFVAGFVGGFLYACYGVKNAIDKGKVTVNYEQLAWKNHDDNVYRLAGRNAHRY